MSHLYFSPQLGHFCEVQFLISRNTQFSITDLTAVHTFPLAKPAASFTFQCFACYWNVHHPSIHLPVSAEGKSAQTTCSLNYKWAILVSQDCLWHDVSSKKGHTITQAAVVSFSLQTPRFNLRALRLLPITYHATKSPYSFIYQSAHGSISIRGNSSSDTFLPHYKHEAILKHRFFIYSQKSCELCHSYS